MSSSLYRGLCNAGAAVALLFGVAACQDGGAGGDASDTTAAGATDASVEATNEALTREFMEQVFNQNKVEAADKYIAVDFVDHTPGPGQEPGLAGFKKMMNQMRSMMPEMHVEVLDVYTDGDIVVAHTRQTGTGTGQMMGMDASGKKWDIRGVDMVRIKDGKAVEHWGYYEEMKFMQQMGMIPDSSAGMPPAAPADTGAAKTM